MAFIVSKGISYDFPPCAACGSTKVVITGPSGISITAGGSITVGERVCGQCGAPVGALKGSDGSEIPPGGVLSIKQGEE